MGHIYAQTAVSNYFKFWISDFRWYASLTGSRASYYDKIKPPTFNEINKYDMIWTPGVVTQINNNKKT
jgi:hypothetical protein